MEYIAVIEIDFYIIEREFGETEQKIYTGYFLNYTEAAQFIADNKAAGNAIKPYYSRHTEVSKEFFY